MNTKKWVTKKRIIWAIVVLAVAVAVWWVFFKGDANQKPPLVVKRTQFVNQISVSGKVTAAQNVDLSFEQPGIVRGVYASVGDTVSAGKLIATQDTAQLYAQASQMQAGIDLQQAKLQQLLAGSSPEDIKIKQDAVTSATLDLAAAYENSVATLTSAYNAIYNSYTLANYFSRTYFYASDTEDIQVQMAKTGIASSLADAKLYLDKAKANQDALATSVIGILAHLNTVYADLKIIREQSDVGVYYSRVSATDRTSLDTQRASINAALSALTSSQQSISAYRAALQQAQNQLDAIKAAPRNTDTAIYDAQIAQAQASLQEIYAQIRKKQIIAPIAGVVTAVNAKVGSIAGSSEVAVSLISTGKFQIESYVPEIYISLVRLGNEAEVTLDAYGPDKKFPAKVVSIDPSETVKDGVSTYKTKLQFDGDDSGFKDGMSANVVVITSKKDNVISIPQGLVLINGDRKTVKVLQGKDIIEKEVQTGEVSSMGQVEILFGLSEGQLLPLP